MNERNKTIKDKVQFFYDRKIKVHIKKKNNWFHNGKIELIGSDFIILIDEKTGEQPIFFNEIFDVEKREEKK